MRALTCEFVPPPRFLWKPLRWTVLVLALTAAELLYAVFMMARGLGAKEESARAAALISGEILTVIGAALAVGLAISAGRVCRRLRAFERDVSGLNRSLSEAFSARIGHTLATRNAVIFGLAKLADCRDGDTGAHLERISTYAVLLADELRTTHREIDSDWIECLRVAASLHDIGKVGIPDAVLRKAGAHTPEERRLMQQHTTMGADTLLAVRRRLGDDPLLGLAIQVTLEHHERWDGAGYPLGLKGDQISLAARIVALADAYDALTTARPYKKAVPPDEARRALRESAGTHFDPDVVAAFERVADRFDEVRQAYQPGPAQPGEDELLAA